MSDMERDRNTLQAMVDNGASDAELMRVATLQSMARNPPPRRTWKTRKELEIDGWIQLALFVAACIILALVFPT